MQRIIAVCLFLLALSLPMAAQKAEVFGGYQYTHLDGGFNMNGWNAALTGNFKDWLGITADFSGVYQSGAKFHTYTFGPVLSAHTPVVQPFAHALFGGGTASGGGSTTGFIMYYGGGVDAGMRHGFGFRVVQVDWMVARFNGVTDKNNVRISSGLVVKF
jgi:hypothetical protein